MKKQITFTSLFVLFSFAFFWTYSQSQSFNLNDLFDSNTGLPVGVEDQISIEQIPKIPKANEFVSIRIVSYLNDLNKAKITWTQDGEVLLSSTGATTNTVQAPASGKTSVVTITIQKENGGITTKRITLSPADVDLIYEAQTYAHPFYKGKRMFTSESLVQITAIPNFVSSNGTQITDTNLVYTWSVNGTVQQTSSGYGKNTLLLKGTLIERPMNITVEVSAVNSPLQATQSLTLRSTQPEVLIYENNPVLGVIYEQAINVPYVLDRFQVDFEAIPYFFDVFTKDDANLTYEWFINQTRITSKQPQENYLLLQNTQNTEGVANISARVTHKQNILQKIQTGLELQFKKVKEKSDETFNF